MLLLIESERENIVFMKQKQDAVNKKKFRGKKRAYRN